MDNGSRGQERVRARDLTAEINQATDKEQTTGWEQLQQLGEQELARDERELTEAREFVGEESKIQTRERLADDLEDARNEAGMGLAFENRIVAKNQEGVAKMVAPEVDKLVGQKSFRPSDLERLYRQGVNTTLGVFNRKIGDRN